MQNVNLRFTYETPDFNITHHFTPVFLIYKVSAPFAALVHTVTVSDAVFEKFVRLAHEAGDSYPLIFDALLLNPTATPGPGPTSASGPSQAPAQSAPVKMDEFYVKGQHLWRRCGTMPNGEPIEEDQGGCDEIRSRMRGIDADNVKAATEGRFAFADLSRPEKEEVKMNFDLMASYGKARAAFSKSPVKSSTVYHKPSDAAIANLPVHERALARAELEPKALPTVTIDEVQLDRDARAWARSLNLGYHD